ncbi:uncharacterized protein PV09_09333 [Verruconis gallopava]|uniref:Uncharacterized protein n=1 Tax=Verruconis gallopava TaxID=253628 RepID=A0A0D2AJ49_9PEZI|nr:uncharacterized protein PV09_09333 [Verruconis gallopava]KIV98948.1 hypothetical protein PV09_09333 [Verruconis gallopava]
MVSSLRLSTSSGVPRLDCNRPTASRLYLHIFCFLGSSAGPLAWIHSSLVCFCLLYGPSLWLKIILIILGEMFRMITHLILRLTLGLAPNHSRDKDVTIRLPPQMTCI